jgi:hypothetical protein
MARRTGDPLPVFKVGGIVRLNEIDLTDWLGRQRDRSLGRPLGATESLDEAAEDRFKLIA